jgi:hypothetical protein
VNNCYLSGSSNGQQQQQQQYQKPLSISANNFSPASNSSFSDNNKTLYKSSSHNINTGGNCDKNYQQQACTQQQYGNSSKSGNSASYLSQSTPSTHFDFEHMFNDPSDLQNSLNKTQSHNTTASGSTRSSRSYQTNQPAVNSDQFQGSFSNKKRNNNFFFRVMPFISPQARQIFFSGFLYSLTHLLTY